MGIETNDLPTTGTEICTYCSKPCQPLRCSACKAVQYCSRACQKKDWKVHKTSCLYIDSKKKSARKQADARKVEEAARELGQMMNQMTTEEAIESFHRANDEVERLKKLIVVQEREKKDGNLDVLENHAETNTNMNTNTKPGPSLFGDNSFTRKTLLQPKSGSKAKEKSIDEEKDESKEMATHRPPIPMADCGNWNYSVEKLIYISTFAVTLIPSRSESTNTNTYTQWNMNTIQNDAPETTDLDIDIEISDMEPHHLPKGTQPKSKSKHTLLRIFSHNKGSKNPRNSANIGVDVSANAQMTLARMILPCAILSTKADILPSLHRDGEFLSLRIQYLDTNSDLDGISDVPGPVDYRSMHHVDNIFPENNTVLTPCEAFMNLQCRSCGQYLLQAPRKIISGKNDDDDIGNRISNGNGNDNDDTVMNTGDTSIVIRNVCHLPSGYWDEITDYLTCYDGQPSIDFSAISSVPGRGNVFEDEAMIVMNREDVRNICVLAIDGYGEQSEPTSHKQFASVSTDENGNEAKQEQIDAGYRGNRDWVDEVGGATLTCMMCCSTLGFASIIEPDAYRLMKHQLIAATSSPYVKGEHHFKHNTCTSFIGKELIRYAEAQAVYTFAVFGCQSNNEIDACMLLRVLSWNTSMAIKGANGILDFQRVVKIIYEEIDATELLGSTDHRDNDDPFTFNWGGIDLCCPPKAKNSKGVQEPQDADTYKSSVNMYLSHDEWKELLTSLENNSKYYSEVVSKTTVMIKLGDRYENEESGESGASLSFTAV